MTTYVSPSLTWTNNVGSNDTQENWINAIHNAFVGAGLVQTGDTGQTSLPVAPGSIPNPSVNVAFGGYLIYRFNDTAQATEPLFIRLSFSSGNNNGGSWHITIRVRIGTGTDGAGNLTGEFYDNNSNRAGYNANLTNPFTAYSCHTEGFFGLWIGNSTQTVMFVAIERSRDPTTGAFDSKRVVVISGPDGNASASQNYRLQGMQYSPSYNSGETLSFCFVPGLPADTSLSSGDKQLYPCWYITPEAFPMWSVFAVRQNEFGGGGVTFSAAPVVTTRTYITFAAASPRIEVTRNSQFVGAMLWD